MEAGDAQVASIPHEPLAPLAMAVIDDAKAEIASLKALHRIARSNTLDDAIERLAQEQRDAKKSRAKLAADMKRFRARKARVAAQMAGMTDQKMQDLIDTHRARAKRREERLQKAPPIKKHKPQAEAPSSSTPCNEDNK